MLKRTRVVRWCVLSSSALQPSLCWRLETILGLVGWVSPFHRQCCQWPMPELLFHAQVIVMETFGLYEGGVLVCLMHWELQIKSLKQLKGCYRCLHGRFNSAVCVCSRDVAVTSFMVLFVCLSGTTSLEWSARWKLQWRSRKVTWLLTEQAVWWTKESCG